MEQYVVIGLVSLGASLLTFFSGFGLGTILLPVMLIYFPPVTAIGITAIVHFVNNLTKLFLLYKHINYSVVLSFGIPSVIGAFIGAWWLFDIQSLTMYSYSIGDNIYTVSMVKGILAIVMILFTLQELLMKNKGLSEKWMIPGGLVTGFFGGLTGHQGAMRSAFLVKTGLNKEVFLATGVVLACLVDITRLGVYSTNINDAYILSNITVITIAIIAATFGAVAGKYLLPKLTFRAVRIFVSVFVFLFSVLLLTGLV